MMILKLWNEISYGIVKGIYATVTKIYDLMLSLTDTVDQYNFDNFTESIYVIVGVFMLFRVAVSLIQMLINPDQISDKQAGAGKLITRIVTCIILLLVFDPNSFLMAHNTGWLDRGQDAIIGHDGFLENFAPEANLSEDKSIDIKDKDSNVYSMSFGSKFLYEDVYAKSNWSKTCYFYNKMSVTGTSAATPKTVNQTYYKITFYSQDKKPSNATLVSKSAGIWAVASGGKEEGVKFTKAALTQQNNNLKSSAYVGNCASWGYLLGAGKIVYNPTSSVTTPGYSAVLFKGANSITGLKSYVSNDVAANPDEYKDICEKNPKACSDVVKDSVSDINTWLPNVTNEAVGFTTNVVSSFQDCSKDAEKCTTAKENQFGYNGADAPSAQKDIVTLMDDEALSLDFIFSIIAGIGLIIFLILLCVDVVVRQLKLLLLSMIAPIPIICYADPKDKIFMTWLKMFFSVYVDLFIKLFAIKIVLILIQQLDKLEYSGIEYFFIIIGILVFAKLVPGMISKIFGLDSMGGSFKDIAGMGKAALGFGAGAAIGGAVGLASGAGAFAQTKGQGGFNRTLAGLGAAGSGISGALKGAGSGVKGNIFGGAKDIAAKNSSKRDLYASGLSPSNLLAAATLGKAGMDYSQRTDRRIQGQKDDMESLNGFTKYKSDVESAAADSKFMKSVNQARANGFNISDDKVEELRDAWVDAQLSGTSGSEFMSQMINPANSPYANDYAELFSDDRFGFDMDNNFTEKGKVSALNSIMNQANADIAGSSTINEAVGPGQQSGVANFKQLKEANTNVKKKATGLGDSIHAATATDKYQASAAANSNAGNKGGK